MRILMFGRGVIATQYGWALEQAGNTVEFYVRPGRVALYGPRVSLDILDARTKGKGDAVKLTWSHRLREELSPDHDYDLIIVSVSHDKFAEAAAFLGPKVGRATVLVFGNLWAVPQVAAAPLPWNRIVWGFPGAGGGFDAKGTLKGGLMKVVFFGTMGVPLTDRDRAVRDLFTAAGFSVSEQKNFQAWLWHHFILDAGFAYASLTAGGAAKVPESPRALRGMILVVRELLPLIRARGVKLSPVAILPFYLPLWLLGFALQKALAEGTFARALMDTNDNLANQRELKLYVRDTLAEAKRLGVRTALLESLEPLLRDLAPAAHLA
jgi:2-dehydropantoate 2-reductase